MLKTRGTPIIKAAKCNCVLLNAIFPTATIELRWGKRYYMTFTPAPFCRKTSATMPAALYYIMCAQVTPCGVVETMSDARRNAATYYSSAV